MSNIDGRDLIDKLQSDLAVDEENQDTMWIRRANNERKMHGLTKEEIAYDSKGEPLKKGQVFSPFTGKNGDVLSHSHENPPKFLTPIEKIDGSGNFARMTKEERKSYALSHGTKVMYLACPMCGRNRSMKGTTKSGNYNGVFGHRNTLNDTFEPYLDRLLQVRKGGGRQIGFFLVEEETLNLRKLLKSKPEIFYNIKSIAQKIVDECVSIEKNI